MGWRWILPLVEIKEKKEMFENFENNEKENAEENIEEELKPIEDKKIISEIIGKKSQKFFQRNYLTELVNYRFSIKANSANSYSKPQVLGVEKIRIENNFYLFTQAWPEDHYVIKIAQNIKIRTNLLFNKIIL